MATHEADIPRRSVAITGWGAMTPLGDAEATTAALCVGATAIEELDDASLRAMDRGANSEALRIRQAGRVNYNPRELFAGKNFRPVDRTGQLAILAAEPALAESGWHEQARQDADVGLVLGTMFGSVHTISAFDRRGQEAGPKYVKPLDFANSVINAAAGQTAIWLGLTGTNSTVAGANAAGVLALAQASQLIRDGRARALIAGGAEELSFESIFGFQQAGLLTETTARPFDAERRGAVLGEAAALLMLEDEATARQRGAKIKARLLGHANAFDPSRGRDPKRAAKTLERALRLALEDAGKEARDIDAVICGACGLAADLAEGRALAAVFGEHTPISSIGSRLGQCLGAGGALQALALQHGFSAGFLPGIAGLEQPDQHLPPLDLCFESRETPLRCGVVTALGLDGGAAAIVLEAGDDLSDESGALQ